jgi:hypothetical protein
MHSCEVRLAATSLSDGLGRFLPDGVRLRAAVGLLPTVLRRLRVGRGGGLMVLSHTLPVG